MTEKEEPKGFKFDLKEFRALNNKWARMPLSKAMEEMRQYCSNIPEVKMKSNFGPRIGRARVYLETTMFNWYFEENHAYADETRRFFAKIPDGGVDVCTSTTVVEELERAPGAKREKLLNLMTIYKIAIIRTEQEAFDLADKYIESGVISEKCYTDGVHVAVASINNTDFIVSLNFEHINRVKTKCGAGAINLLHGYATPDICTPMEVIYDI